MTYCRGPYAQWSSLPSPTTTTIPAARQIDFATRRYVIDDDGNSGSMDPTAQRVMLAMSFGAPGAPRFLTDQDLEKRRQQIATALQQLEDEGAITVKRIDTGRRAAGDGFEQVDFINHRTGEAATVTRP